MKSWCVEELSPRSLALCQAWRWSPEDRKLACRSQRWRHPAALWQPWKTHRLRTRPSQQPTNTVQRKPPASTHVVQEGKISCLGSRLSRAGRVQGAVQEPDRARTAPCCPLAYTEDFSGCRCQVGPPQGDVHCCCHAACLRPHEAPLKEGETNDKKHS